MTYLPLRKSHKFFNIRRNLGQCHSEIVVNHNSIASRVSSSRVNLEDKSSRHAKMESSPIDVVYNMLSSRVWKWSSLI